jgi:hypothetical protein
MTKPVRLALVVYALAVTLFFVGQAFWPQAGLYAGPVAEAWALRVGSLTKLLLLGIAAYEAWRCVRSLEADNPARGPWRLFALGLLSFFFGQAVLSSYQIGLGESPYPSPGDVFFLTAYPLLILASIGFVRAYGEAGYPVGTRREHVSIGLVLSAVFLIAAYLLLRPVLAQPGPLLERVITAAYPALDFLLLVPVLILLRVTAPFRGGAVFRAWSLVLFGIVALCAGDILYAYFQLLGREGLGPLVDATYVLAYLGLALGKSEQRTLLAA